MIHKHKSEKNEKHAHSTNPIKSESTPYALLENPMSIPPMTHPATNKPTALAKMTSGFRSVADSG